MKLIPLTQGKFAMVDDADYEDLIKFKWQLRKGKKDKTYYAKRGVYNGKSMDLIFMHRQIMGLKRNDGRITDHRDGNGLNNQRSNLRLATYSQNNSNRRSYGASKFLGVAIDKRWNIKYTSAIMHNKKRLHIGNYKTEIEAAKAYDAKAKELHGEFANLNFKQ